MRGSNINHCSSKTGWSPLHWAVENNHSCKIIKFLLKNGGNPHIEDVNGLDVCDKAKKNPRYKKIKLLTDSNEGCQKDPELRIPWKA